MAKNNKHFNNKYVNQTMDFTTEVETNHSSEFAPVPFNGLFVAMHKTAFENEDGKESTLSRLVDNITFGNCCCKGRGTAALQHVTPGSFIPRYPTQPVEENRQGQYGTGIQLSEPFMNKVIIISGGEHVDVTDKWFKLPMTDDELLQFAKNVQDRPRSDNVRSSSSGGAEVLDFTSDNTGYVESVFDEYFPTIPKTERGDYVTYLAADTTTYIYYALSVFERDTSFTLPTTHNGRKKLLQERDKERLYVHPETFTCDIDNERLNRTKHGEAFYRMVFNGNNPLMIKTEDGGLNNIMELFSSYQDNDTVVQGYITMMRSIMKEDVEYATPLLDKVVASQAASIVLNTHPTPMIIKNGKSPWKNAEHALSARLHFIAQLIGTREPNGVGSLVSPNEKVALGTLLQTFENLISPNELRTYRKDAEPGTSTSNITDPWFKTHRQLLLHHIHKANSDFEQTHPQATQEEKDNVCFQALMSHTMMSLVNVVAMESVYNADEVVNRLQLVERSGEVVNLQEKKSFQVRLGVSEMTKKANSMPELILAHFYYDIGLFKRYFLQYSHHLLQGKYFIEAMRDNLRIGSHPITEKGQRPFTNQKPTDQDIKLNSCDSCQLPFYRTEESGNVKSQCCMCYVYLCVICVLHSQRRDYISLVSNHKTIWSNVRRNPYNGTKTYMKIPVTLRTLEGKGKVGTCGNMRIKHGSEPDGFKVRANRAKWVRENTKIDDSANLCNSSDVSKPPSAQSELGQNEEESNYSESISLDSLAKRVSRKLGSVLSEHQSRVSDNSKHVTGSYFQNVIKGSIGEAEAEVLDANKALKHHLQKHHDDKLGHKTQIDCFLKKHGVFRNPVKSDNTESLKHDTASNLTEWETNCQPKKPIEEEVDEYELQRCFDDGPEKKRPRVEINNESIPDNEIAIRRLVKAVVHSVCSGNSLTEFDLNDIGTEHREIVNRWKSDRKKSTIGQAVASVFKEFDQLVDKAVEEYVVTLGAACRKIHELTAEELNQSPEDLDDIALNDIMIINKPEGKIHSWFDPTSGDPQVTARCEKVTHYAMLRQIIGVKNMSNPTKNEGVIDDGLANKYTRVPNAKLTPHCTPINPNITIHLPLMDPGSKKIKLGSTQSGMCSTLTINLPVKTKVDVSLTPYGEQKKDTTCHEPTETTVVAGDDPSNQNQFRCFPLLKRNVHNVFGLKHSVRSVQELSAELRQRSLKMSNLGFQRSVDLSSHPYGIGYMRDYIMRREVVGVDKGIDKKTHPTLIRLFLNDIAALCKRHHMMILVLKQLSKLVGDKTRERQFDLQGQKVHVRIEADILPALKLQKLWMARPELLGVFYVLVVGAELYGTKSGLRLSNIDGRRERRVALVRVMIPTCLRLFIGKRGTGRVNRSVDEKQTTLTSVRNVYLDYVGAVPLLGVTYDPEEPVGMCQSIHNVQISSYGMKESIEFVTKLQSGTPFSRLYSLIGRVTQPVQCVEEIQVLKTPMVHGGKGKTKHDVDDSLLLLGANLGEIINMLANRRVSYGKLCEYFISSLKDSFPTNTNEKFISRQIEKQVVFNALIRDRFRDDDEDTVTCFKQTYFDHIYDIMIGATLPMEIEEDDMDEWDGDMNFFDEYSGSDIESDDDE